VQKRLNRDTVWDVDSGPRKHALDGDTHWRHTTNTTELPMCGGYAAFLSNYFDHLACTRTQSVRWKT